MKRLRWAEHLDRMGKTKLMWNIQESSHVADKKEIENY
jgi:hypothetical protein